MASTVLARMAVQISANSADLVRATQQGSRSLLSLSRTAESAGRLIGAYFGVTTIFRGVSHAVGVLAGFEQKMQEVRAVTGATGEQFLALQRNATALGASTEYTATQIAGLQAEFGRLGFSTKEILDSTKATVNLATATGSDLARSAEIAGSTLRAFQLDAKEMGRVTDVMSSSFNKSALQLDNFAESIKYVAPIAKAAGVSIEETTAYLSALADAGIKGSQAGTGMRRIFAELAKDGRPVAERMQELADKGLTLEGAFDEVGRYAQTALLVLASQTDKVHDLTAAYKDAAGEARRTAEVMRDTLSNDFKLLTSAIDGAIQKGTLFGDMLRKLTQATTDFITVASGGDIQVLPEDELRFFIRLFEDGNKQAGYFKEKLIELAKAGEIVFTDTAINQYIERFNVAASKAAELRKELKEIQQQAQKRINNQGVTDIDPITGLSLNESKEALELGKKAIDERKQKQAAADLEAKQAAEELNKKYRERLELAQQIYRLEKARAAADELAKNTSINTNILEAQVRATKLKDENALPIPGTLNAPFELKIIPDGAIDEANAKLEEMEDIADHIEQINNRIAKSYFDLATSVLEAAGTAIGGGEGFGRGLLRTLANFGKQFGAQLISIGAGYIALGYATDNPDYTQKGIALGVAGAALVVASSALSASISKQSRNGPSRSFTGRASTNVDTQGSLEFRIRGKDLVAVMNTAQSDNDIRKGG